MTNRKPAAAREMDFKLAIHRIEQGRAHKGDTVLSITAVAREAGVNPSLIHNHYPKIADAIRIKQGASSRQARDAKHEELRAEQADGRTPHLAMPRHTLAPFQSTPVITDGRTLHQSIRCATCSVSIHARHH